MGCELSVTVLLLTLLIPLLLLLLLFLPCVSFISALTPQLSHDVPADSGFSVRNNCRARCGVERNALYYCCCYYYCYYYYNYYLLQQLTLRI